MKAAFWNYYGFSFIGSFEVDGAFSPVWDLLTPQTSTMRFAGDYPIEKMMIVGCPLAHGRTFLGIVSDVKKTNGMTEVTAKEILSILDVPCTASMFDAVDYASGPNHWLYDRADEYFNDPNDLYQSLSWLTFSVVNGASKASPAWSSNETTTILSALEEFVDAYGSIAKFSLRNSNTQINCEFDYSSNLAPFVFDLRTDCFSGISYSDNSDTATNKVTFKPMSDNYLNMSTVYSYVLLSDGTISNNLASPLRITPVVTEISFYSDEDLGGSAQDTSNIETSATEILNVSKYSHEVKFRMRRHKTSNYLKGAFAALVCGSLVTLYGIPGSENTPISTKVTRIQAIGDDEIEVICGYSRSQLTDKLKMRDRIEKGGKMLSYSVKAATKYAREWFYNEDLPVTYEATVSVSLPKNSIMTGIVVELDDGTYYTQDPHDVRLLQRWSYTVSTVGGVQTITVTTGDLSLESTYIGPNAAHNNWVQIYVRVNYSQLLTQKAS